MASALHPLAQHPVAAHQAALNNLARLPIDEKQSIDRMFRQATKLIADTLEVERVGIWLFDGDPTRLRCACQYVRSLAAWRSGEILLSSDFPAYVAALTDYRAIIADDAQHHPMTRELAEAYLVPHGITSMLDAPLKRHGEVVGVVCHEHVGPQRAWTHAATGFVASVADLVTVAMEQAVHIEARRALEEHARRAEEEKRMASLGRVAAAVGHDFGHVLTIVLSRVQEILAMPDLPAAAAGHATAVVEVIRRSRELTRQLADLGRGDDAPVGPIELDQAIGAAAQLLRAMPRRGQQIEIEPGAPGVRVRIDRTRLDQVLINLVGNALDATQEGCTVRVATSVIDDDAQGGYAVLRVTDDGAGIDDDTRPRIFEPYFTTKRADEGTGLGLAIVHAFIQRAGGFILVDSAAGKGTSVAVHLPVAA